MMDRKGIVLRQMRVSGKNDITGQQVENILEPGEDFQEYCRTNNISLAKISYAPAVPVQEINLSIQINT